MLCYATQYRFSRPGAVPASCSEEQDPVLCPTEDCLLVFGGQRGPWVGDSGLGGEGGWVVQGSEGCRKQNLENENKIMC